MPGMLAAVHSLPGLLHLACCVPVQVLLGPCWKLMQRGAPVPCACMLNCIWVSQHLHGHCLGMVSGSRFFTHQHHYQTDILPALAQGALEVLGLCASVCMAFGSCIPYSSRCPFARGRLPFSV